MKEVDRYTGLLISKELKDNTCSTNKTQDYGTIAYGQRSCSEDNESLLQNGKTCYQNDNSHPDPLQSKISETSDAKPQKKYTPKQWMLIFILAIINLGTAAIVSLQAPFFPAEVCLFETCSHYLVSHNLVLHFLCFYILQAEMKGANPSEYGLVFGVYELVIFLTSPIYGKYVRLNSDFI